MVGAEMTFFTVNDDATPDGKTATALCEFLPPAHHEENAFHLKFTASGNTVEFKINYTDLDILMNTLDDLLNANPPLAALMDDLDEDDEEEDDEDDDEA